MVSLKYKFRQIKKLPGWIYILPALLLRVLYRCCFRHELIDPHNYSYEGTGMIGVTWHNRLLMFPTMFPKVMRKRTVAVISASRDGQYIADFAAQFGAKSIRGSSTRQGVKVLHDAIRTIKGGCMVIFTPDGPRGPRYHMSKGPIHIASKLGIPVVALGINYSAYWAVKSWDGFRIPKPWAKLTLVIGNEVHVPPDLTADELEHWRQVAEDELNRASLVEPKDYL